MQERSRETTDLGLGDAIAWNELIGRLDGPLVLTHEWARCMAVAGSGSCRPFILRKDGDVVAAAWYRLSGRSIGPFRMNRRIELEQLPCYDPGRVSPEEIIPELLHAADREGAVSIAFGNSPADYRSPLGGSADVEEKFFFLLDLRRSRDELKAGLAEGLRRNLRRARDAGVRVDRIEGADSRLPDGFENLFAHTITRHIEQGKGRSLRESSFFTDAARILLDTRKAALYLAQREGERLSCALVALHNGSADYVLGASSARGYELRAAPLILWTAVEELQQEGFRSFSLGAVPARAGEHDDPDHGLYRFKKSFGGECSRMISGTIILKAFQHGLFSTLRRVRDRLA